MAKARTRAGSAFPFSKIHSCQIHPGVGIARVGNSPDQFFIGPEAPIDPREIVAPDGGFKDAGGRIKRQAARFRIYAYDKNGNNLGELPIGSAADHKAGQTADVEWKVHLKNKKGAWYKFHTRFQEPHSVRNSDVPVPAGKQPDAREILVVDPGARCIDGHGQPVVQPGIPKSLHFDTGQFRGTSVPLGELQIDRHGRLLVLGGHGMSGSTKDNNPIGSDPTRFDYWADNDCWYDDVSDGPVTASVTLPNGKKIAIDKPKDAGWVIVGPPKYAPGVYPFVSLYDVMREVAVDQKWIRDEADVTYYRDIYPLLARVADLAWVNHEAQRGHGYDKRGNFRAAPDGARPPAAPSPHGNPVSMATMLASRALAAPDGSAGDRARIFARIRNPLLDDTQAADQANGKFMPLLSGDDGDRTEGEPRTWLTVLPLQYAKFEQWKNGKFTAGQKEVFPPLDSIADPDEQTEALQRAALEPCIGGAFYPGIEASWSVRTKELYAAAFRIDSKAHGAGDITKLMCVPWQADFYDCKDTWWPAARPDDVIPQDVFNEANKAWRPGQPPLSEGLEGRVKWDRGLGVTTLFRRPWHNPAEASDDPRDSERRGCDDMVRYWHELGFVVPRRTAWRGDNPSEHEIVLIETERLPHAGMDVRELFNCLLNLEENRSCLPKVREFVDNVLEAGRQMQQSASAFAFMDNIRPFKYTESVFEARMKDIYDDCADFAFTEQLANGVRIPYNPSDPVQNPYFRTREAVTERIRQLTPFNFLDGSWLRNIHRVGPVDEVNAILFTILKEELGDGVPSQNHANIYFDLCHSFGFYPPPIQSTAFARDPQFLDCAFDSPAFQLGISEFSNRYYPEIIGMSLWLEWTVMDLHRIASIVDRVGLSSHFYRMHIAIDNAASGHGAEIMRAVKIYLRQVLVEGGEEAVEQHWTRIWDGYVAFAYTFAIIIRQVVRILQKPRELQDRLEQLIRDKAPFGQYNHGRKMLGGSPINSLFAEPTELLKALQDNGYIVPGKPNESPFFKLLEFRGGPMYHVFTEDEIKLWRDWTWELGEKNKKRRGHNLNALKDRLATVNPSLVRAASDTQLSAWQVAAGDHRIALWLEIASQNANGTIPAPTAGGSAVPASRAQTNAMVRSINERFKTWLGWSMVRALTSIAAQNIEDVANLPLSLSDLAVGRDLTIAEWFHRIRAASNSAVPARALLQSLGEALRGQPGLMTELFGKGTPLGRIFDRGVPGNDGRRALDTLNAWITADCPIPQVPAGKVKPLRMEASLDEEETHPTGIVMGFGTVH